MRLIQSGPKTAKIVIVGEAPGATEDSTGIPFHGASGELLDRMLSRVGIDRSACFVTNVVHTRPPKNDFDYFLRPKVRPEYALGVMQLKKDLDVIRPNVVIALGGQALRALTSKNSIDKWRGSILESTLCKGTKVIGTYHPAYILRIWDYKCVAEFDLKRAADEAATPEIIRPHRDFYLDPDAATRELLAREMESAEWLSIDIECVSTPTGWRLACVGFSDRPDRAMVIPVRGDADIAIVRRLCTSPARKVFQNGTFDCTVLKQNGIEVTRFEWDTMLAHHALYAESASGSDEMSAMGGNKKGQTSALKKGLGFLTSIYTKEPYYKDDGKLWHETNDLQMFWRYNALDAAVTREIRDVQEVELREFGVVPVFDHAMSLVRPLMACTDRGIRIDLDVRAQLTEKYSAEIVRLQSFLDAAAGGPVNVKSSDQVMKLLYDVLKLPPKRNRITGNPTANKDAINELAQKHSHPVLLTILEIRNRRDFIERYLNAAVDADGRMRCSFDITGTRSGRLSSRQSIYGSGTNLQNIPARKPAGEAIRRMFVADPGKVFVYRDYSQAEARVVAYLSRCTGLIELFEDPSRDIHTENAARIFGRKVARLVADGGDVTDDERYLAKRVVHACNYGMAAPRLVQVVNEDSKDTGVTLTHAQAQRLIDAYFMLYPEIRENFWREVENELRYTRTLDTPFGRKRTFYGRWDDKLLREAYSYKPQSTVGDLGAKALVACYHAVEQTIPGCELLLNVHDSILMQCDVQLAHRVAEAMERAMAIPITVHGRTFTIPTDCKVGRNWAARHKKDPSQNPHGLVDIKKWVDNYSLIQA